MLQNFERHHQAKGSGRERQRGYVSLNEDQVRSLPGAPRVQDALPVEFERPNPACCLRQQSGTVPGTAGNVEHLLAFRPSQSEQVSMEVLVGQLSATLARDITLAREVRGLHWPECLRRNCNAAVVNSNWLVLQRKKCAQGWRRDKFTF